MRILKTIWWYIRHGRPMRRVITNYVRDLLTREYIHIYCDAHNNYWTAKSSIDTNRKFMEDGEYFVNGLKDLSKASAKEKAGFMNKTMEVLDEAIASVINCPENE